MLVFVHVLVRVLYWAETSATHNKKATTQARIIAVYEKYGQLENPSWLYRLQVLVSVENY